MKSGTAIGAPEPVAEKPARKYSLRQGGFSDSIPLYADAGMRVLATAFDVVVMFLVVMLLMVVVDAQVLQVTGSSQLWIDAAMLGIFIPFVYFVGCWAIFGASPGKMLLSLRVVDAKTQGELSLFQCLLRYAGCLLNIFSFGLGAMGIFSVVKPQGWHDRLAGTVVVIRH